MLLKQREIVSILIDDCVLTIKTSDAGSGEGVRIPGPRYAVLYEDAHGETSVEVMNYQRLSNQHLKGIDPDHLAKCVEAIKKLHADRPGAIERRNENPHCYSDDLDF